jgi:hypothetical protein
LKTNIEVARIAIGENDCAQAIGMSVPWLRKDRRTKRLIPYYRIGNRILYDLSRVKEALLHLEEGGNFSPRRRCSEKQSKGVAA